MSDQVPEIAAPKSLLAVADEVIERCAAGLPLAPSSVYTVRWCRFTREPPAGRAEVPCLSGGLSAVGGHLTSLSTYQSVEPPPVKIGRSPGVDFTGGVGGMMAGQFQPEFEEWRRECELIDREISSDRWSPLTISEDERQVRKFQFASLIERRNAAARKFLSSRGVMRRVRLRNSADLPGDRFTETARWL